MTIIFDDDIFFVTVLVVFFVLLIYHKMAKMIESKKKRKNNKNWKLNNYCMTLEINDYNISKLSDMELSHIQTRKDNTSFLVYCTNCLLPGHPSTKCKQLYNICVIGDSHTQIWNELQKLYINSSIIKCRIPGMSSQGLTNNNSYLQSSKKINSMLNKCHQGIIQYLFVQVGQVDTDFVYYFKLIKNKQKHDIKIFINQAYKSINNLFLFLEILLKNNKEISKLNKKKNIIIHGIHLPTLNNQKMKIVLYNNFMDKCKMDKKDIDQYFSLPNHVERTKMALVYNKILQQTCNQLGYGFMDITSNILDLNTKIVSSKYVNNINVKDVHLDSKSIVPVYHDIMKKITINFALEIDDHNIKIIEFYEKLQQKLQD